MQLYQQRSTPKPSAVTSNNTPAFGTSLTVFHPILLAAVNNPTAQKLDKITSGFHPVTDDDASEKESPPGQCGNRPRQHDI